MSRPKVSERILLILSIIFTVIAINIIAFKYILENVKLFKNKSHNIVIIIGENDNK